MSEHSHPVHGKISVHGGGFGAPSPETVEKRAREIALIAARDPDDFTDADWDQARRELLGVSDPTAPEETEENAEVVEEWNVVASSAHRAPRVEDDENLGEQLVSDGIEEAAHDQMLEARREELEKKADLLNATDTVVLEEVAPDGEDRPTTSSPSLRLRRLLDQFRQVRNFSRHLCQSLEPEDYVVQSMPDVSPTKWHLAHTTWFFETFVVKVWVPQYRSEVPEYAYLFNSYYNAAGDMHRRDLRGLISRPTVAETERFRESIDRHVIQLIESADEARLSEIEPVLTLGMHHEQQHQELLITDIKHVFFQNPLFPVFRPGSAEATTDQVAPPHFVEFDEATVEIGHSSSGFSYDNEGPRHRALVLPFSLADRLVTNGEYLEFMAAGGYSRPEFWLSLGWTTVNEQRWQAPLYWLQRDDDWWNFTLSGLRPVDKSEPVTHVSYFEADAYANWNGARLATEFEWERAAGKVPIEGNFVDEQRFHPVPAPNGGDALRQMFGDVWEWTRSAYLPYPGYRAAPGALGEYNGKFMCNQMVLRGGSCATSRSHIRPTYRNFFQPEKRWQFTGIRLARDLA